MKNLILVLFLLAFCSSAYSQDKPKRKHYFPIWTYHQDNITINGISLGLYTDFMKNSQTNTNGIKLELIGTGFIMSLMVASPSFELSSSEIISTKNDKYKKTDFSERINGIYLSGTGSFCNCLVNGISLGFLGQSNIQVNGFSASLMVNYAEVHNGMQSAFFTNDSFIMKGVQVAGIQNHLYIGNGLQLAFINNAVIEFKGIQIGVFNRSSNLRGIQIGLWNVNQKRKMPIINWNFEKEK